MAIARMTKIMIVTHRSEAARVLEALQQAGLVQVLDAETAMVSKEWPELHVEFRRPKGLEEMVARLEKAIAFLKDYATEDTETSVFNPRVTIDKARYLEVVSGNRALELLSRAETIEENLNQLAAEGENLTGRIHALLPWEAMETPVEAIRQLNTVAVFPGLLPYQHFDDTSEALAGMGAAIERVGSTGNMHACIVACPRESAADVQKVLRSNDFEAVSFEGMTGRVSDLIAGHRKRLAAIEKAREDAKEQASEIAKDRLSLQILYDHYRNLLKREVTHAGAPATESVILFEGWAKKKDYRRIEKLISGFSASSVSEIAPAEGELPPVEIDNLAPVRPFELITRLYGLPVPTSIDPTAFLAPFFAIFFGLCLNDAGYGLVLMAVLAWVLKKARVNRGPFWMLMICAFATTVSGAITGGWFGDAITALLPEGPVRNGLDAIRIKLMLFDPMLQPMTFFALSLGLGYLQIQVGLFIAFVCNLLKKDIVAAIFDQLTWIVMLNCLVTVGLSKGGVLPASLAKPVGLSALVPAVLILLFSGRGMGWGGRIGFGVFQLFSTVFYMGDMLSYVRLMALGMVGAGFGIAINVLVKLVGQAPYVGWFLGALVFVVGHIFNLAMSMLGAFVHTMRLQFVEFFPKFFTGGGEEFAPLRNQYTYVDVRE